MYASRTGTRRNLAALRAEGWRLLVSPAGVLRTEGFPYALDNGAWTYHQKSQPFDGDAFTRAVDALGANPRRATVATTPRTWRGLLLFALQDGMTAADVAQVCRPGVGLFIGGTTAFKERDARAWGAFARERSLYLHMGRVNSARRIAIAAEAGVHSVDGTSATRFAVTIPALSHAASQTVLAWAANE